MTCAQTSWFMAEYASEQDEASLVADWLREGKMNQSCSSGFPALVLQQKNFPLLKKLVQSSTGYRPSSWSLTHIHSLYYM